MAYEAAVLRAATARLEAVRRENERALEERRQEIYAQLPRVAEIDRELKQAIVGIIRASLKDGSDDPPSIEDLRRENLALQAERSRLLLSHGWSEDALEPRPHCPKCADTGWRGAEMCGCLKALCAQEQIRELSKLLDLGEQTFDAFSLDCYSPLPDPARGISARENMEMVRQICWDYANKFGRYYFDNLFLSGAPGLGKTFLSACIARTVSENGFSVVYDTAVHIFAQFEAEKFARDREAGDETRRYLACDLLILDDLGTEMDTAFTQSALYTLLNTRLSNRKRTVVSSNLTMDDVSRRYSPQIASRLRGEFRVLPFFGEDIRLQRQERM